jgi:uncharacterized membrane protein YgdD (TMEM256/DUF423 family)
MNRNILALAAILGVTGIILGAFGAHGLKQVLEPEQLTVFETGVKYQMYHALFLLFVGISPIAQKKAAVVIFWLTFFGVLLFSGSIYLLACDAVLPFSIKPIGFITPIGGLLLIGAWVVLFLQIMKRNG